ncbi:MAG: hypothetical protein AB7G11_02505 [Phycisphaerales bacterium]
MSRQHVQEPMVLECAYCGENLSDEEAESPHRDAPDGDIMCDECYHDKFEFTCCKCEDYGHINDQHKYLVVFDAEEAFSKNDCKAGFTAGLYRVKANPYYTSDYLSAWLNTYNLERIGDLPTEADENGYPCGHLCKKCQDEVITKLATKATKGMQS